MLMDTHRWRLIAGEVGSKEAQILSYSPPVHVSCLCPLSLCVSSPLYT